MEVKVANILGLGLHPGATSLLLYFIILDDPPTSKGKGCRICLFMLSVLKNTYSGYITDPRHECECRGSRRAVWKETPGKNHELGAGIVL